MFNLPLSPSKICRRVSGYSLLEILLVLAVIVALGGIVIKVMAPLQERSTDVKLTQDVAMVNRALRQYELAGGNLDGITTATHALNRLKTTTTGDNRKAIAGLKGSMVDARLSFRMQTAAEAASPAPRALYVPEEKQFVIQATGSAGISAFTLDNSLAEQDFGTESRATSFQLAKRDKWVWDYDEPATSSGQVEARISSTTAEPSEGAAAQDKLLMALSPPVFSIPPGTYPLRQYPLNLAITNPNPPGSSEVLFSPPNAPYQTYAAPFSFEPGAQLGAYVSSTDPDNYGDSDVSTGTWLTVPETPVLGWTFADTRLSYRDLGGPMLPSESGGSSPAGMLTLLNPESIPPFYQHTGVFQPRWTRDGSDPLTSTTAEQSPGFNQGYPGDTVTVTLASWPAASSSLQLKAAAKTLRPELVNASAVHTVTLDREVVTLPAPVLTMGGRDITLAHNTATNEIPVGARIYFTTDGTDPGNNAGEPVSGMLYTGPFSAHALTDNPSIFARTYPPANWKPWFTPGAPVSFSPPSTGVSGGFIAGQFTGTTGNSVARLLADGTVDSGFNAGAGANAGSRVQALATLGTGVIVGGDFTTFAGVSRKALAKLDANGSVDPSFAPVIEDSPAATPFTLDFASLGLQQNVALNGTDTKNTTSSDATHGLSPNGGFNGFGSQTFSNINGSGIDLTLHYSQNMTDADPGVNSHDGPNLHGPSSQGAGGENPDRRVTGASPLRITNDRYGTITPATVGLSFSEPVYFDRVIVGNLSGTSTAAEHGLFRAFSGANASGSVVAATTAENFSAENGPLLGTSADPVTANANSNLTLTTPTAGLYLAKGTGSEAENRYGRARFTYTTTPVQSMAFSNWTTSTTAGSGGGGDYNPSQPFGVAQTFSIFAYGNIELVAGGGSTVGGVAAGGNLKYGYNGGFYMGGAAGRDALVVQGVLDTNGNGSLSNGNVAYGSTPNANLIYAYNGTKRQATNVIDFAGIKTSHLALSTQWKALPNTGGASSITYGTPGGDGKVPITLNAGNLTGTVVFNMDASKLVNVAYWNINNVNSAATLLITIPGTTPTLQNFYISNAGTANKTIFHFPDATTATFSSVGIPGTVFAPKALVSLGSNGSQIGGQIISDRMDLRSFHNGGQNVFTGTLPGPTGGPPVTTVDGGRGAVTFSLAGFRRTTALPGKVWVVRPQADGKLLIGGRFQSINGTNRKNIARLNANGTLDTGFDPGTGPDGEVHAIHVLADGRIVVGGQFNTWNGAAGTSRVVLLTANGTREASFTSPVSGGTADIVRWLGSDSSQRIYVAGKFSTPSGGVARLNANGSVDSSFSTGSGAGSNTIYSASVRGDGSLLVAGDFTSFNGAVRPRVALLSATGAHYPGWNPGTGFNGSVFAVSQRGGSQSLLMGGSFSQHATRTRPSVSILTVDNPASAAVTWGPFTLSITAIHAVD